MSPTLAALPGWAVSLLVMAFLIVCIALILIVLIQRPQGGGLSGAFGAGGGAGQTAFGTKTGDVLTLVTIGIFVLFLLMAIGLNFAARPTEGTANQTAATAPAEEAAEQVADDAAAAAEAAVDANENPGGPESEQTESTGDAPGDAGTGPGSCDGRHPRRGPAGAGCARCGSPLRDGGHA